MNFREMIDERPVSGLQMAVIAICFTINMLDGFDVMAIAYSAPSIAAEWGLKPSALGAVFSAGIIGTTLGAVFLAPYSDRIGRRAMILTSLAVISVTMIVTGYTTTFWEMFLIRFVNGVGIGSMLASLTAMGAEYMPNRHRNLAIGVLHSGYLMGATFGGFIAAILIPALGWESAFFAGGVMALLMFPVVLLFMPESLQFLIECRPQNALKNLNTVLARMRLPALDSLPEISPTDAQAPGLKALLSEAYRPATVRIWAAFFATFVTLYFVQSWMPKIVVDAGLPLEKGIYAGIAVNLGGAIGTLILGQWSVAYGLRRFIVGFLICGGISMIIFGISPAEVKWLLSLSFLIGFFTLSGFIGLYVATARVYPTQIRTTGVGWAIGAGRAGAILSPYVGGVLIGLELPTAFNFLLFSLPLILAGATMFTLRSPELEPLVAKSARP